MEDRIALENTYIKCNRFIRSKLGYHTTMVSENMLRAMYDLYDNKLMVIL